MALLADDRFGLVEDALRLFHPFGEGGVVLRRFDPLVIIFFAEDEHDDVGVLLDRTGFAQVGQLRALVVARFHLTRQLRQRDDRNVQLLRDGFQTLRNLGNLVHAAVLRRRRSDQLKIVDKEHVQPVRPLQPPGAGGEGGDGQGGGVVDPERNTLQIARRLDDAAEFVLLHIAAAELFGINLRLFGQDAGGELFGAHFQAEKPDRAAVHRAFGPVRTFALTIGLGDAERDIGGEGSFTHRRTTGENNEVGGVKPAELLVHIDQAG